MGLIYAEIELINGEDLVLARRNFIGEDEIKSMRVNMLVDAAVFICVSMRIYRSNYNCPFWSNVKGSWPMGILWNITL